MCPGTDASVTPYELPATAFVYSISGATNDDIGYIAKTVGESIYSEVISAMCTGSSRDPETWSGSTQGPSIGSRQW